MDRKAPVFAVMLLAAVPTYGAHPLITEDTGTQGRARWQLELNGERNRDRVGEETVTGKQAAAVLSYGFAGNADLQLGLPYLDDGSQHGIGDASLDVKWRFYENGPVSLALKPGVTLPSGDDRRGLGTGRATWGSFLIFAYEHAAWALNLHAGYRHNRNTLGERSDLLHGSGAISLKPREGLRLVFDLSFDTDPDPASEAALRQMVVGAIWSVTKDFDLDLGVRRGNAPAIDRAWLFGLTYRW